MLEVADL